jgi:hypothetical protein
MDCSKANKRVIEAIARWTREVYADKSDAFRYDKFRERVMAMFPGTPMGALDTDCVNYGFSPKDRKEITIQLDMLGADTEALVEMAVDRIRDSLEGLARVTVASLIVRKFNHW